MKVIQVGRVSRYLLKTRAFLITEKKSARVAGTLDLPDRRFDQVRMAGNYLGGAQVAAFDRNAGSNKTPQYIEGFLHKIRISTDSRNKLAIIVDLFTGLPDLNEPARVRGHSFDDAFDLDRNNIRCRRVDRFLDRVLERQRR